MNPILDFGETSAPAEAPPSVLSFVGIDPGMHGFSARINADGSVDTWATPTFPTGKGSRLAYDVPAIYNLVASWRGIRLAMIEQQQAFPEQGGVSNFTIGFGYGLWKMALIAARIPFEEIRPSTWKKNLGISVAKAEGGDKSARSKMAKKRAIEKCQGLYPHIDLRATERAHTPSPDKAESILLAVYGRRTHAGV